MTAQDRDISDSDLASFAPVPVSSHLWDEDTEPAEAPSLPQEASPVKNRPAPAWEVVDASGRLVGARWDEGGAISLANRLTKLVPADGPYWIRGGE
jgi:hypothetical protein